MHKCFEVCLGFEKFKYSVEKEKNPSKQQPEMLHSLTSVLGCAKFVDRNGKLKPSTLQASQINFDKNSEHMGESFYFFFISEEILHVCILIVQYNVRVVPSLFRLYHTTFLDVVQTPPPKKNARCFWSLPLPLLILCIGDNTPLWMKLCVLHWISLQCTCRVVCWVSIGMECRENHWPLNKLVLGIFDD